MIRTRWWDTGVLALVLMLGGQVTAAPAPAPESPLAIVPSDAPIVVQLRGIDGTKTRLLDMVKNAVPNLAPKLLPQLEDRLKEALLGRQLKGLAPDGPDFLVVTDLPPYDKDKQPLVAVLLKVTKYQDFLDGLLTADERKTLKQDAAGYEEGTLGGSTAYFINRADFAIVTPSKDAATQLARKQPGLDTKLSKDLATKLLDADVAAYVDMEVVNKPTVYGGQIKEFRRLFEFFLDQAMNQQGGQIDKGTLDTVKRFYGGLFQFLEDSRTFVFALSFRPEGAALSFQSQVGADTPSGTFLKDTKPVELKDVSKLPAEQMAYFMMKSEPAMMPLVQSWIEGILPGGESQDDKAIKEALDVLAAAGAQTWLGTFSIPVQALQVGQFKDPAKAAEGQLKLYQALKAGMSFQSVVLKNKPDVQVKAQEHRGFKLNAVSLEWDFTKFADKVKGGQETAAAMHLLMGQGVKSWFGTDGKVYVQISAKDWDTAKGLLDNYLDEKNTVGENKAFQQTQKQLPTQATMVAVVDVSLYADMIVEFMRVTFKAQGVPFTAAVGKGEKGKSYLGMALVLQPGQGNVEVWIPGSAADEVRKIVEPVIKGAGGK